MGCRKTSALVIADMEGISGIYRMRQVHTGTDLWRDARSLYRGDVRAAAVGLHEGGARTVFVRDTHDKMHNLRGAPIHPAVHLLSGFRPGLPTAWGTVPPARVAGLVGAHVRADAPEGFFPHTLWAVYSRVELDGVPVAEIDLLGRLLGSHGTPVSFVTGDKHLVEWAVTRYPWIEGVEIQKEEGPNLAANREDLFTTQRKQIERAARRSWERADDLPLMRHEGPALLRLTCRNERLAIQKERTWNLPRNGSTLEVQSPNFMHAFESFFRITFFGPHTYRFRGPLLKLLSGWNRLRHVLLS